MTDRPKIKYKSAPPAKRGRGRPPKAKLGTSTSIEPFKDEHFDVEHFNPERFDVEHFKPERLDVELKSSGDDKTDNFLDLSDGELVKATLRKVLQDQDANPAAKASAARTLAEITGLIGRNAKPPADEAKPLSALSRDELAAQLAALE